MKALHKRLVKRLRKEPANKARELLIDALEAYLADYGSEGYDLDTFSDFVIAQTRPTYDAESLIRFYEERAALLRRKKTKTRL